MEEKRVALDCNMPAAQKMNITLEAELGLFIGIIQALQFTIDNKEKFQQRCECPNCFHAIEETQETIAKSILAATKEYTKEFGN